MTLGKKIMELRKHKKMTQEQVADKLKVARQTISNWELDQTKPDLDQIKGLSKLYNISVDELIDNNIKDLLTEKISNVEKLTGFVYKLLIIILVFVIVFILFFIIDNLTRSSGSGSTGQNIFCSLNNETYEISILAEGKEETYSLIRRNKVTVLDDNMPVTKVSVSPFIAIPDLEKYDKFYKIRNVVFLFFESKGGSCY